MRAGEHDPVRDVAQLLCGGDPCCTCRRNAKTIVERFDLVSRYATAERCTAESDYGGHGPSVRCALTGGHRGNHDPMIHGYGSFSRATDGTRSGASNG